ncbi:hypothetical protein SLA2020_357440 [Shorea laevis]
MQLISTSQPAAMLRFGYVVGTGQWNTTIKFLDLGRPTAASFGADKSSTRKHCTVYAISSDLTKRVAHGTLVWVR